MIGLLDGDGTCSVGPPVVLVVDVAGGVAAGASAVGAGELPVGTVGWA